MSQEIEIEFKNLLTKEEYEHLLHHFAVRQEQIHRQENHYFDTHDYQLRNLKSGLRIRIFDDGSECTLKEQSAENIHLETTEPLSDQTASQMLQGTTFEAPAVEERLRRMGISVQDLQLYGTLKTYRAELAYHGGILVLDRSNYLQIEDYEVEYETNDEKLGSAIFDELLTAHQIEKRPTPKKIARFTAALQQQFND